MADRKVRWTPQDREAFKRAWEYLDSKTPDIQRDVADFNKSNPSGWDVSYTAEEFKWGHLKGDAPSRETTIERFGAPKYTSFEETLLRHGLTEADLNQLGEFASLIGSRYNLNVKRSLAGRPVQLDLLLHASISYDVKPKFDEFRQV